ncbi:MAG: PadR family transcriptional regulator [Acidobacteriaceae bacterium]|nr:PadR family transcriptional regulator [Acidobacteriaceae bacterium]MBV8572121.1 PadR family transcriptional regulator [Acidobacteriaceae bacterium]
MGKHAENNLQGSLELLILKTLERGPNHGFGITTHVEAASEGLLQIEEGSLYPALHRLEKSKLIAGSWKTTPNGRRARFYTLTGSGAKRLEEARANWKTVARGVKKVMRFA